MSNLFPVFKAKADEEDQNNVPTSWLTIGSSFDDIAFKKKEAQKNNNTNNQTNLGSNQPNQTTMPTRKTAKDLIAMDSDSSEEEEKKKKKKQKKKKDKKRLAVYDPVFFNFTTYFKDLDDTNKVIGDDAYTQLDEAVELYMPKRNFHLNLLILENELTHQTKFLYKHIIRKDLLPVSIIQFGEKENYEYGAPQIKEVPLFRRLRKYSIPTNFIIRNIIIGLKSDKNTLEIIDELNRIQGINRSIMPQMNDSYQANKRYYNIAFGSDEFYDIERNEKPDKNLLKLDFIELEKKSVLADEDDDMQEFRLKREEMSNKEADLLEKTKEFNKKLEKYPEDVLLWIDFINFQDKHHQGLVGKSNASLIEKKLAILEKAMSNPKNGQNPLMILYHLRLLHQSSKSDDFYKVLHTTWEKYLNENSTNVVFWVLFTDFKYSYFSRFSIIYMRETFAESLNKIQDMMNTCGNTSKIEIYKQIQLYLIKKLCNFEKMSGFYERAFGIFQSLLEINLFPPPSLTFVYNKEKKLQNYQSYYETYTNPKVGELITYRGWIDSETKLNEMKQELKEKFIGIFEFKLLSFSKSKEDSLQDFINMNIHYLPNESQEHTSDLLEWLNGEFESMKTWRPANNSFDKTRIEESEDSIVLYDDIQNYLIFVNQETFKIEVINNLLQLLDLPSVFSGSFLSLSSSVVNYLYSKKLQIDFENIANGTFEPGKNRVQIVGIEMNDLFLRYPRLEYIVSLCMRDMQYLSRVEYARRLMGHLSTQIPECNQILSYSFYIDVILSRVSETIQTEEIKESKKRLKNILKTNEKNIFLWIMYAEQAYQKDKKIEDVTKVYENLLRFVTSKKQILIVFYFYINFYLNSELTSIKKSHYTTIQKLILRLASTLEKTQYKEEEDITIPKLMQASKILKKHTAQSLLSTESKSKKNSFYNLNKIFPLTKSGILIYLHSVCSILLMDQDIEEGIQEFKENCVVLEKQLQEKSKHLVLDKRQVVLKNNQDALDLTSILLYRILVYKKHSNSYINPQILKKYMLDLCKKQEGNILIAAESIKSIYSSSFRSNQLFKIKSELQIKFLDTPLWYLIITEELKCFVGEDKEILLNLLKTYFNTFNTEETLYDHLFFEMEKKYSKLKDALSWEDYSYLNENYLYLSDLFGELYLKFISLFYPDNLKREALILLHRFPFSKEKYLNYLLSSLNDEGEIKRIFTMLTEKEIRMYRDYNFA